MTALLVLSLVMAWCQPCDAADPVNLVDSVLSKVWKSKGIEPAKPCGNDQFLRRVTLDLAGRIPTGEELKQFRGAPDRAAKIDELLASDDFPRFMSGVWAAAFNGHTNAFQSDREVLRIWLERSIRTNTPYDKIVSDMISTQKGSAFDGAANFLIRHPQEPVVKICRLFLGVRLDCARCHDHPFARWKQNDLEAMNRFFAASRRDTISPGNSRTLNVRPAGDAERPRFLTGAKPRTGQWRDELALFVVSCKPFARTYANRVWYHLMGRGIVHPIDDFHRQNPPSVPALLEALTAEVTRTGFQLKPLLRSICNSRAYQCSSVSRQASAEKKKAQRAVFALRQIKPLTAEQTYDSVMIAIEQKPNAAQRLQFVRRSVGQALDEDFSHTWQYRETVQSLMARLNMTLPAKIATTEKLYRRILSRDPSAAEVKACRGHSRQDITFALVNSNEFFFNH